MPKPPSRADGSMKPPRPGKRRSGDVAKDPPARRPGGRGSGRSSRCREPGVRTLLLPYALSQCTAKEAVRFETHLLGCAACFRDLRCLGRIGTLLRELLAAKPGHLD